MHSPSPTPEHSFADLLDVDSNIPDLMSDDSNVLEPPRNQDILDLFDAPNTDTTTTTIFSTSMTTGDTTTFATGVALTSVTAQDNPFVDISEQESSPAQAEDAFPSDFPETASTEKRPSVASTTGIVGSEAEGTSIDLDFSTEAPIVSESMQPSTTAAELFSSGAAEQLSTAASESAFFSVTDTIASSPFQTTETSSMPFTTVTSMQPTSGQALFGTAEINAPSTETSSPFASDLLGDFGEPAADMGVALTSPVPAAEFPISEAYKPEEQLDNFAAATKVIESASDAFDIFASKFDKAAEQETNAGDPFFDAFGGGPTAMDTSSDGRLISSRIVRV